METETATTGVQANSNIPPLASLFVGDLHGDIDDRELFAAFEQIGKVASVRVCKDSISERSLGYGYVNFMTQTEAQHAIDEMNMKPLREKVIRVMWSKRDPDARRSGIGNVFVKNLHESIDAVKLSNLFIKFGNIESCKVVTDPEGNSKGYGFVQFELEEAANAAILEMNEQVIEGKELFVSKFLKKSERLALDPDMKFTNLYIKNLESEVTEDLLKAKFSEFGKITSYVIMKDNNGSSRGFGFVNYENPDDAKRALESTNGSQFGSKILYVARAMKKAQRQQFLSSQHEERKNERFIKFPNANVYVKNIEDEVDDNMLREKFSDHGEVISIKVMRDDKGVSKGFGFVCFSTAEEAKKAIDSLHGFMFHGKPLYVAIAQRKEERLAQLQLQFSQRNAGFPGSPAPIMPARYPALSYYTPPYPAVSTMSPRQGIMYQPQPMGMRPAWRPNGLPPHAAGYQPMPVPLMQNHQRGVRQARRRMNGSLHQSGPFMPQMQQTPQLMNPIKENGNHLYRGPQLNRVKGLPLDASNGHVALSGSSNYAGVGTDVVASLLANTNNPHSQKQIIGNHLYPLVAKHKPELAGKITGMLLEMDNSELLLLLDSPDSLALKMKEAEDVLEFSKEHDHVVHSNVLSS